MSKTFDQFITESQEYYRYDFVNKNLPNGAAGYIEFVNKAVGGGRGKLVFQPTSSDYGFYGSQLKNDQKECVFRIYHQNNVRESASFVRIVWDIAAVYFLDSKKMQDDDKRLVWLPQPLKIKNMAIVNKSFVKFSALKESLQEAMSLKDAIKIVNPGDPYLRNMVKALSMHPFLNTKEENDRLEAAKLVLKNKSKLVYKGSRLGYAIKGE